MKHQGRNLILLIAVLAILIGAYYGLQKYAQRQEDKKLDEAAAELSAGEILSTDSADILSFRYTCDGTEYAFVKEDDTWYYTGDRSMAIDADTVTTFLNGIAKPVAEDTIGEREDLSPFGLDEGYTVVAWTTADAEYEVHLGDCNDTLGQYYLCEAGSHEVYLVDSYYHTRLQKTAEDFRAAEESSEDKSEVE